MMDKKELNMMDKKELNVMDKKELEFMELDNVSGGSWWTLSFRIRYSQLHHLPEELAV